MLELGPGPGLLKETAKLFELEINTVDIDPQLSPDCIALPTALPFKSNSFDAVCAFQMLEHLTYNDALDALNEMKRVSRDHVIVSLPDAKRVATYYLLLPKIGAIQGLCPWPLHRTETHAFDGQHHWEINKKGYPLSRVERDLSSILTIVRTYRVWENPYHRFFVLRKKGQANG